VEAHGGVIWAENRGLEGCEDSAADSEGTAVAGARFTVWLPEAER
jgi:signal transduction histidine kinase